MSQITDAMLDSWRGWIGREERRSEMLEPEALRRYAVAIGDDLDIEHRLPALGHWAFFLPVNAIDAIGIDGHPLRGGLLPPVTLPQRMFAAAEMEFNGALSLGTPATLTSTVIDVRHRIGRSGDLIFVDVRRILSQHGTERVSEKQTIVYRERGDPIAPVVETTLPAEASDCEWRPDAVQLFRFSAVTFNSHRIHYDLPYTVAEEGYPRLVVHGPLTAAKLCAYATFRAGRSPTRYSFRGLAPLFVSQPVRLVTGETPHEVKAIRCDGALAVVAQTAF